MAVGIVLALAAPALALMILFGMAIARMTNPSATLADATRPPSATIGAGSPLPARTSQVTPLPPTTEAPLSLYPAPALTPTPITASVIAPSATTTTIAPTPTALTTLPAGATATTALTSEPATATPTSTSTSSAPTVTDTPTSTATQAGPWGFINLTFTAEPDNSRNSRIYGELVNNSGAAQEIIQITGTFFDAQNQVVAGPERGQAYWPLEVIPAGAQMPFEVTVFNAQGVTRAEFTVNTLPSDEVPRSDFQFSNVNSRTQDNVYCVQGELRNPGEPLQDYLVIAILLYDSQDRLINFGDEIDGPPFFVEGDRLESFDICIAPPNQNVARHEPRAWGR